FFTLQAPQVYCAKGPFLDFINDNVPILKDKFWPTLWCFESRAQTVFANLLRSRLWPYIKYRREILILSDGGEVALDWAEQNCCPTSPIMIILPGLTGASHAEYIKCLVYAAKNVGIKCVIFNNRGLGGVKLKTPRLYCASNCEDLNEVIEHVHRLHPNMPENKREVKRMYGAETIPLKEVKDTKNVAMIVTSRGGHIGFLEGIWPVREEQYMGKVFAQFFTAVFTIGQDHPAFY
ncbi:phospholipase ABHD3-like, partial [Copidosoma floridanum]|uniref:phospholipase ABHD3-like n=1 Tax=Copidosoma floridanum TaxID=29053 RepID=UPI000C6FBD6A